MRRALGVPPGPLGLAVPELEAPLPPLVMAVWPPLLPGPPLPTLELFDLDKGAADGSVRALSACSCDLQMEAGACRVRVRAVTCYRERCQQTGAARSTDTRTVFTTPFMITLACQHMSARLMHARPCVNWGLAGALI